MGETQCAVLVWLRLTPQRACAVSASVLETERTTVRASAPASSQTRRRFSPTHVRPDAATRIGTSARLVPAPVAQTHSAISVVEGTALCELTPKRGTK